MSARIDKKAVIWVAAGALVLVILLAGIVVNIRQRTAYRKVAEQHREMVDLAQKYMKMHAGVDHIERRARLAATENLPVLIEEVMTGMGLKDKLKSVKPFGGGTKNSYEVQEAEIVVERLSLNEMVNVLHSLYTVPAGLFVTSSEVKRDFSERNLLNARMSVKLIGFREEKPQ